MPTRAQIADRLTELLGPGNVETEEAELRRSSIDRYRKYQEREAWRAAAVEV